MVSFNFHLGKKKGGERTGRVAPKNRALALSKDGFNELEIIRMMRQEGYSPMEVDDGLKDSLKSVAAPQRSAIQPEPAQMPEQRPVQQMQEQWKPGPLPEMPPIEKSDLGFPRIPGVPAFEPPAEAEEQYAETYPETYPQHIYPEEEMPQIKPVGKAVAAGKERELEDLAEVIVDEKMDVVREKISDMNAKLRDMERRFEQIEARIEKIGGKEDTEIGEIKKKIDEYSVSMNSMGTKVESIENVMKDSLQSMLQTMRSLSDAVRTVRGRGE